MALLGSHFILHKDIFTLRNFFFTIFILDFCSIAPFLFKIFVTWYCHKQLWIFLLISLITSMAWGQSLYICSDSCQLFLPSCYVSFQKIKYLCTLQIFSPFSIEFCCFVYLNLWCTWLASKQTDSEMPWPHMYCLWL